MPVGVSRMRGRSSHAPAASSTSTSGDEQPEVPAGAFAEPHAERRDGHLAAEQIQARRRRRRPARPAPSQRAHLLEHRQREDVEGDVVAEHGIGHAEGLAFAPAEDVLPRRRGVQRRQHRRAGGEHRAERLAPRGAPAAPCVRPSGVDDDLRLDRQRAGGDPHVRDSHASATTSVARPSPACSVRHGAEHLPVPDLVEPPPVGGQLDGVGQDERQQGGDGEDEDTDGQSHEATSV